VASTLDPPATPRNLGACENDGVRQVQVALESTGVDWWPVYHALAQAGIEVCVCNAAHAQRAGPQAGRR
jgi:intracellular sulfur oxidation DsrE/DsrF family protein